MAINYIPNGGVARLEITRTFFYRTDMYESGGAVVIHMFASADGAVLSSGNLEDHSGYVEHSKTRV